MFVQTQVLCKYSSFFFSTSSLQCPSIFQSMFKVCDTTIKNLELCLFSILLFIIVVPLQHHANKNWTQLHYRGRRWSCGTSSFDMSVSLIFYYPCVDPPLMYLLMQKMNAMPHLNRTWTLTLLTETFWFNHSTNGCTLGAVILLAQTLLYMGSIFC